MTEKQRKINLWRGSLIGVTEYLGRLITLEPVGSTPFFQPGCTETSVSAKIWHTLMLVN